MSYSHLYKALDYSFQDASHLKQALTHRSASNQNNERLEFLGDSLLGFLIADELFLRFPRGSEGQLTRLRSLLVKRETLAEIAQQIDLKTHLLLGTGELKSGGWRRASILADTLEAIIAAVYLDGGLDACRAMVKHLWRQRLDDLSLKDVKKDAKTRLQELLQSRQAPLPVYQIVDVTGEPPKQCFRVTCRVSLLQQATRGKGSSRRYAEQDAAKQALQQLQEKPSK